MLVEIDKVLSEAKDFIKDFSDKILGNELNDSAKQVLFLDNQQKMKNTMDKLTGIKTNFEALCLDENDGSEDAKRYEMCVGLMNKLVKTLKDYKASYSGVNPNVTIEDTTPVLSEETINDAMKNNTSTQQIVKDMNTLNERASIVQMQEFTHAILVGKKFTYTKVATVQELNNLINEIADANPNEKISVYEVVFNPVPLKTKTIYTV